jgi:hypothetical protein
MIAGFASASLAIAGSRCMRARLRGATFHRCADAVRT